LSTFIADALNDVIDVLWSKALGEVYHGHGHLVKTYGLSTDFTMKVTMVFIDLTISVVRTDAKFL